MTELSAETDTTDTGRIIAEPPWIEYLRQQGYIIEGINEAHCVPSNSRDMSHLVVNITTYDKPRDRYDAVEDVIESGLWICSCEDFTYNKAADVSENMVQPSDSGRCKHILSVSKVERAKDDDSQMELGE